MFINAKCRRSNDLLNPKKNFNIQHLCSSKLQTHYEQSIRNNQTGKWQQIFKKKKKELSSLFFFLLLMNYINRTNQQTITTLTGLQII